MKRKITMKKWLFNIFTVLFIAFIIVMIVISEFTKGNLKNQAALYNEGLVDVYMEQLDKSVEGVDRLLSQYLANSADISVLALSPGDKERVLATHNVLRQLRQEAFAYNMFTGFFVYSQSPYGEEFICQNGPDSSYVSETAIRSIVKETLEGQATNGWQLYLMEGRYYLLKVVSTGSSSCGAWMDLDMLLKPLAEVNTGENGGIIISDIRDQVLICSRDFGVKEVKAQEGSSTVKYDAHKYLQITKASGKIPVTMSILISERVFSEQLIFSQTVILLIFALILVSVPVVWQLLDRRVTKPVENFLDAMNQVQQGDFSVKKLPEAHFEEFDHIFTNFNAMVNNVRQLKEDVYDRQLREQKILLQYYQLQIRPHFFLNILNVIYSFSLVGQNALIEKLTISLSKYFRYLFRSNVTLVTLGAECDHIKNYMDIQKIRYSGGFDYTEEVDDVLKDALVPPLVIQTFVENSIKYASDDRHFWSIALTGEVVSEGSEQKLRLVISDSGSGYPQHVLDAVAQNKNIGDDPEKNIGIINVKQRLNLIYGQAASLRLYNPEDGGAATELILPLAFEDEERAAEDA